MIYDLFLVNEKIHTIDYDDDVAYTLVSWMD